MNSNKIACFTNTYPAMATQPASSAFGGNGDEQEGQDNQSKAQKQTMIFAIDVRENMFVQNGEYAPSLWR